MDESIQSIMSSCACGRWFGSTSALEQHRTQMKLNISNSQCAREPLSPISEPRNPGVLTSASPSSPRYSQGLFLDGRNQWMKKNVGTWVDSISQDVLLLSESYPVVSSTGGAELICSYNWVDDRQPKIFVPGGAPVYRGKDLPVELTPFTNFQYVDQNAFRVPEYPFEVIFEAAEVMNPEFRFSKIDIITNRNSLRQFLDFCRGRSTDSFRVNLFLVKNTLIIERCVRSPLQWFRQAQDAGQGLGHAFEKAVTELPSDLAGSTSHHRVLHYNLAGLECAVRFEVDACVDASEGPSMATEDTRAIDAGADSMENLVSSVGKMNIHKKGGNDSGRTVVVPQGHGTDQKRTVEIKSSAKRLKSRSASIPQMWFGRTPWLIRGSHENGTYSQVMAEDLSKELQEWELREDNQLALQKMSLLLSRLREVVRATEKKSCILIYAKGNDSLRIFLSTSERKPLPDTVIGKFWESSI